MLLFVIVNNKIRIDAMYGTQSFALSRKVQYKEPYRHLRNLQVIFLSLNAQDQETHFFRIFLNPTNLLYSSK